MGILEDDIRTSVMQFFKEKTEKLDSMTEEERLDYDAKLMVDMYVSNIKNYYPELEFDYSYTREGKEVLLNMNHKNPIDYVEIKLNPEENNK